MATKTTSATKSNTAKSKISQKALFNPKQLIVLMIAIVALIGFVFIFLSRAGSVRDYVFSVSQTTATASKLLYIDPATNNVVKEINLPEFTAMTTCTDSQKPTYRSFVQSSGTSPLLVVPVPCTIAGDWKTATLQSYKIPIIDTTTNTLRSSITFTATDFTEPIVNTAKNEVYVRSMNQANQKVSVFSLTNGALIKEIPVTYTNQMSYPVDYSSNPMFINSTGSKLYLTVSDYSEAANANNSNIMEIDLSTRAISRRLNIDFGNKCGFQGWGNSVNNPKTLPGTNSILLKAYVCEYNGSTLLDAYYAPVKLNLDTMAVEYRYKKAQLPPDNNGWFSLVVTPDNTSFYLLASAANNGTAVWKYSLTNLSAAPLTKNTVNAYLNVGGSTGNRTNVSIASDGKKIYQSQHEYTIATNAASLLQHIYPGLGSGSGLQGFLGQASAVETTTTTVTPPTSTVTPPTTTVTPPPTTTVQPPAPAGTTG